MDGLFLRLFGVPQVEGADGEVIRPPTKKAAALLAYLALHHRQPQSRSKLAALLWEDSGEQQARESLRQTLSLLRKALPARRGQWLATQGDTVALDLNAIAVDIIEFEELAASGDIADIARAAELYRDVFVDGLDLRAPAFESWLRLVRQQFREKVLDVLSKLLAHHAANGNLEGGISIGNRIVALDPLREDAHRALMELYAKQRRHAAALRQYRICADALARELNVEPEAATTALYRRIREQRSHPQQSDAKTGGRDAGDAVPAAPSLVRREPVALERKQITVLACGLQGIGALAARMDPEELHATLGAHRRHCAEIVGPFGGVMGPHTGECTLIYFGYREADEHGAERAIRAALALVAQPPRLGAGLGIDARPQIGIATGQVVSGEFFEGQDERVPALIGDAPRHAALLQAAAGMNGVAVSAASRELVGDLFEYQPLPLPASGGADRIKAFRVLRERRAASRFGARPAPITDFTGRDAELAQLLAAWGEAQFGDGQIFLVTGEAGIGKSRLARMCAQAAGEMAHPPLIYQCSPFHAGIALYPFIQQLEQAAGFRVDDQPGQRLDKLEAMLSGGAWRVGGLLQLFADLLDVPLGDRYPPLGLKSSQQRRKTFAALLNQIEHLARKSPLMMIFEDAHWADPSSLELLDLLCERVGELPILLTVTSRPGFTPAWDCLDHVHTLALTGLAPQDARAMVRSMCRDKALRPELAEQIAARTDGVPLFVEELTKALLEAAPARQGGGPILSQSIPATLQDALSARLDRLGAAKATAQIAAVIGRDFSECLLAAVAKQPADELHDALAKLAEAGLIARVAVPGQSRFAFNHALVQEAAYQSLLKSRRQQLHAATAEAILSHDPHEAEGRPELLAHHYTGANMVGEALRFWLRAGKLAFEKSALKEAAAHLGKGLDLLKSGPALGKVERDVWERQFLMALGPTVMALKGYGTPDGQQIFERAHALTDDETPLTERLTIMCGLLNAHLGRSQFSSALPLARELLDAARASGSGLLLANCMMGQTLSLMGEFKEAREHLQYVIDVSQDAHEAGNEITLSADETVLALGNMSNVLWALGDPAGAAAAANEAAARVHAGTNAISTAIALLAQLFVSTHSRALDEATALFAEAIAYCQEHSLSFYEQWVRFNEGFLRVKHGQIEQGLQIMTASIEASERQHNRLFRPFQLGCLAKVHFQLGDRETALSEVDAALAHADMTGERQSEAGLRRLRCEILIAMDRMSDARDELRRALDIATRQGVRAELRRLEMLGL